MPTPITARHVEPEGLSGFARVGALEPTQLVRLLILCGLVREGQAADFRVDAVLSGYNRQPGRTLTLSDFAEAVRELGLESDPIAAAYLTFRFPCFRRGDLETEEFFKQRIELLDAALDGESPDASLTWREPHVTGNAFDALDCFSRAPSTLLGKLWRMATGPAKTFQTRAQRILDKEPDTFDGVTTLLGAGQAPKRAVAARWLGKRSERRAAERLRAVLAKEKNAVVQDALLTALANLGVESEDLFDVDRLTADAKRRISKAPLPPGLSWIPFDSLPAIRNRRTGEPIDRSLAVWWVVQAFKLKSPEPGGLLRRQLATVDRDDLQTFGEAVLRAWIDFDTMPMTQSEVSDAARRELSRLKKEASYWGDELALPSIPEIERRLSAQPSGSAIKAKGILAIAATAGGGSVVRLAIEYVREWYGLRAAQCKALVRMLAWIDDREAIQFLTATARRFWTAGVRTEAQRALEALAERRGWPVEKLADCMVPDAGLDGHGRMVLDFGARRFVAELDPGLRLQVRDESGDLRKDLPKPGVRDDPNLAEAARKQFGKARRLLRVVGKEQTDRLFAAVCVQRRWPREDWQDDLLRHPVLERLCRRLVWRWESGERFATFRPVGDQRAIHADGATTKLPDDATVFLAHDLNTTPSEAIPWIEHFEGYAVEPLFPQLNRGLPDLAGTELSGLSIDDFSGASIDVSRLGVVARRLGYQRGEAIDGPTFYDYRRQFPALRLEVRIDFSGQDFGEHGPHKAELGALTFWRKGPQAGGATRRLSLADVPPVLLVESYRDYREIAHDAV